MKICKIGFFLYFVFGSLTSHAKYYTISSPDKKIVLQVSVEDNISWAASVNGMPVFRKNTIRLHLEEEILGLSPKVISSKKSEVAQKVTAAIPVKSKIIDNRYNQLFLKFKNDFSLTFRVFDNGIAYRFNTSKKGEITVVNEFMELDFAGNYSVLFPEEESVLSHYERLYLNEKIASLDSGRFCSLPALVKADNNIKIGITEADLFDYPCLFLEATGKLSFKSKFPKIILESEPVNDRKITIKKNADYMAVTEGARTFPWRVFMISESDAELVENQMVYLLSRENKLSDYSWIKPGLVAWDWWNDNNIYGVDFKSGINNQTYKYYIDFAAQYGIPYIILDEGWSKTTTNVLEPNPNINIRELVEYGKAKNVGVILWSLWGALDKDMDTIINQFAEWGVKGVKVDFMMRADQYMVNFYERLAKACAERYLLVDYHGAFKPTGLHRTYPNIMNYEGVKGLENNKKHRVITPEHDVTICFTRMLAGPMDYTPGAMRNANKEDYFPSYSNPGSMGTRCHQMAMFVVYDAPVQMLADNPTNYYKENECIEFISKIKTEWGDTKILDAKVSDYIVTARRRGSNWYIGALTDFDARTLEIALSFLGEGDYEVEIMQDGVNADKNAMDYKHVFKRVNRNMNLRIQMAPGGGWVAICRKL